MLNEGVLEVELMCALFLQLELETMVIVRERYQTEEKEGIEKRENKKEKVAYALCSALKVA